MLRSFVADINHALGLTCLERIHRDIQAGKFPRVTPGNDKAPPAVPAHKANGTKAPAPAPAAKAGSKRKHRDEGPAPPPPAVAVELQRHSEALRSLGGAKPHPRLSPTYPAAPLSATSVARQRA